MNVHVIPKNDERPHLARIGCECCPIVEEIDPVDGVPYPDGGKRVIHHAYDCREVSERVTGEMVEVGKGWIVVEETEKGGVVLPLPPDEE